MSEQGVYINNPSIRTGISVPYELTKQQKTYRGIMANMLVQYCLMDTIKGMSIGHKCSNIELANMIADKVGIQAAQRS